MAAQDAFAKKQYSRKHFSPGHRGAYLGALALGYAIRAVALRRDREVESGQRSESRAALSVLLGFTAPPFGSPPEVAVAPRAAPSLNG
jgi:hypothetical protein